MFPDPEMLAELGLGTDLRFVELERAPGPSDRTGHGYVAAEMATIYELAAGLIPESPALTPFELPRFQERVPEGTIFHWDLQPAVIVIQAVGAEILFGKGASLVTDGMLALDSRNGKAFARIRCSRGEVLVGAEKGAVRIFEIAPPLSKELDALSRWEPPAPVDLAAPPIEELLQGAPAPQWIREAYEHLCSSASPYARAAAVGLIARLWSPPATTARDERKRLLEFALAGGGPTASADRWFGALPEDTRRQLLEFALLHADRLQDRLYPLAARIADEPPAARSEAQAFVHARDDLESLRFLFRESPFAQTLNEAAAGLDREISAHHTIWSAVEAFTSDPRLEAVSWQEPLSWWGRLAHAD